MWEVPHWAETTSRQYPAATQRGFSLLELVIVIILVILLFLVAFDRLLPLRGQAEAAHVATVIGGLRSAVGLEAASRVVDEGLPGLAGIEGSNPMAFLQEWPETYIGPVRDSHEPEIDPGTWYFERKSGTVGYRVRFPEYLEQAPERPVDLRWRIELDFEDRNGNGRFDPETDRARGVRLKPLDPYNWPDQSRGRPAVG